MTRQRLAPHSTTSAAGWVAQEGPPVPRKPRNAVVVAVAVADGATGGLRHRLKRLSEDRIVLIDSRMAIRHTESKFAPAN
jgi:hypothetical protein